MSKMLYYLEFKYSRKNVCVYGENRLTKTGKMLIIVEAG